MTTRETSAETDTAVRHFPMWVDGRETDAAERLEITDPSSGRVVATTPRASVADMDAAIESARAAFERGDWSRRDQSGRAAVLHALTTLVNDRLDELIELETMGNGATVRQATAFHIGYVPVHLDYFAGLAERFDTEVPAPRTSFPSLGQAAIRREPIGVVGVIAPFNFPLLLALWKIAPALAVGNSVVVKPDENTSLALLLFARLATEAGLPDGVLNVVTGLGTDVGARLASHPDVGKIGFTGSVPVGREIMRLASGTVKNLTLELGGKSPAIVLPDADVELTAQGLLYGGLLYSGQVCESMTRLLVHESIHDAFVERIGELAGSIRVGPRDDWETDLGPVISARARERILGYVDRAVAAGARLVAGGHAAAGDDLGEGFYVEPTVLADVTNDMEAAREEIFGPVLVVIRYSTVEEAIALANDSEYGLAASVWSRDNRAALEVAARIRAGSVWINDAHQINCFVPFGGYKQSGLGRELGPDALLDFVEQKAIHVDLSGSLAARPYDVLLSHANEE